MALTALHRKIRFFRMLGEHTAFMAKYAMDGGLVQWVQLGGPQDDEWARIATERAYRDRRFRLNCAQFVRYAAYSAGLPPDARANLPEYAPTERLLVDPSFMGLGQWIDEAFSHTSFFVKETTIEWRYVIYRFNQTQPLDESLDISSLRTDRR